MKTLILLSAVCMMSLTTTLFGQTHTQTISFADGVGPGNAGTYSPTDHFSVDLYLTFNGYNATGLSLWFETTANGAPFIFLTGFTYGTTFPDPNQPFAGPIGFTQLQSPGFYTTPDGSDLGATQNPPFDQNAVPPGTYFIGHLTVSLAGLAPGVYVLRTDATNGGPFLGHASAVASYFPGTPNPFRDEFIPSSAYTITVIPEPGTLALLSLGAMALVAASRMRKA